MLTRTDRFIVGALLLAFALVAGFVGVPALLPVTGGAPSAVPSPVAGASPDQARPYREGVVGHPI
ncbi:MAG: hypothetical protein QOJ75_2377, partial [Chloroflexota bacterium]|nr:hypothetical protein [Chloroflexota bacterium]